ncbi:MAG TPA: hypothetical protein VFV50_11095, partial [Bdellovibrionales bacterium]|nr:hypothetical protein [Bdellovibrionales bacterium]
MTASRARLFAALTLAALVLNGACKSSDSGPAPETPPNNETQRPPPEEIPPTETYEPSAKDAIARSVDERLQTYHSPHGLVYAAFYREAGAKNLLKWEGVADSALWSGTYLAAQAFRFRVTQDARDLDGLRRTLEAVRKLSSINGDGLLARHFFPVNDPTVDAYLFDNADFGNVIRKNFEGTEYYYLTRTSRDQYAGIFFGLSVTYSLINDAGVRSTVRDIVTRLTE